MNAYERAVKLLAIREHSKAELKRKLIDKGYSEDESEEALIRLISLGWQSDYRFAQSYIRSRLRKSPEGKNVLLSRLREKGCDMDAAMSAVEEAWEEGGWREPLLKAFQRQMVKKGEEYATLYFRKKGFSFHEIEETKGDLDVVEE